MRGSEVERVRVIPFVTPLSVRTARGNHTVPSTRSTFVQNSFSVKDSHDWSKTPETIKMYQPF